MKDSDKILNWAIELQSLAQTGLFYSKDKFDIERFQRIREISAEMLAEKSELSFEKVKNLFCSDSGYQTPKVDTRAAIFKDEKILLVHEDSGNWAMPGGWCDVELSPVENTIKEAKEEAGLDVVVDKLVCVQDRDKHNFPKYVYNVVKIFYLCTATGGHFEKNIETSESKYFSMDELPPMANEKCTAEQVKLCFEAYKSDFWVTQFD